MLVGIDISNPELNQNGYLNYVTIKSPLDLKIEREEVFYRESFSDIIDYIKFLLNLETTSLKIEPIKPKGSILIDIPTGTDINDYLKLIAKTFTLKHVELKYSKIFHAPHHFIVNISKIFDFLGSDFKEATKKEEELKEDNKIIERALKYLFIIDVENDIFNKDVKDSPIDLFESLFYELTQNSELINFIENGIILVGINHNEELLHTASFNAFDIYIKIPAITESQRKLFLEKIQEKIINKWTFDIEKIVSLTEGWEVLDLKNLINTAILRNASKSESTENGLTDLIEKIIEKGEYVPYFLTNSKLRQNLRIGGQNALVPASTIYNRQDQQIGSSNTSFRETLDASAQSETALKNEIDKIKGQRISDFMVQQLYEEAASEKYTELIILLDKLKKEETLEDYDKKILAEYSFILNDPPNIALILLEKAKKRIDNIKKAFGKG